MAPVDTLGIDTPVNETGQIISTVLTFSLALATIAYVVVLWRRERIVWPMFVVAAGTLTCLMEPAFDHLYGLWFREEGAWALYETFGSHQPVWVPAAYTFFYGGAAVVVARTLQRSPTMRTVRRLYFGIAAMAIAAEMAYVSILGVYEYQDSQPFVIAGYPVFLGFTNAMSALVAGMIASRLAPRLRGANLLALLTITPAAFAAGLFGTGILYLSVRHSVDDPSMVLVSLAALTVVGGIASTVRLLGKYVVVGEPLPAPADAPSVARAAPAPAASPERERAVV